MPSILQKTLLEPPGEHGERRARARQPVGGLVHRAVAAERHHDVEGLPGRRRDELDRVPAALGLDRLHVVAALERVDHEVLEPHRHRRRVRVDDDQHPLGLRRLLERGDLHEPALGERRVGHSQPRLRK